MKLSDFENEEALDLLADMIEPAADIMQDEEIVNIVRSGKPKLFAVKRILKEHRKSAIEIIAALHKTQPDKVRFNVATLAIDLIELMNDPQIIEVFSLQSQMNENKSSGSATENTEGEGA